MNATLSDENFEALCEILSKVLKVDRSQITLDTKIHEDLGADSLDDVEIVMALEERFDTSVDEAELDQLITVGALCDALAKALACKAA